MTYCGSPLGSAFGEVSVDQLSPKHRGQQVAEGRACCGAEANQRQRERKREQKPGQNGERYRPWDGERLKTTRQLRKISKTLRICYPLAWW